MINKTSAPKLFPLFEHFKEAVTKNPKKVISVNLFVLAETDTEQVFPLYETSSFHDDERYYCYSLYKPISQISKLL